MAVAPAGWLSLLIDAGAVDDVEARRAVHGPSAQVLSRSGALRGRSLLGREPWLPTLVVQWLQGGCGRWLSSLSLDGCRRRLALSLSRWVFCWRAACLPR